MARVLLVDDEETFCQFTPPFLADDGHEVRTAQSGREAIDTGARFQPDVLIADWLLDADCNGLTVAAALRRRLPNLAVIFVTGLEADSIRPETRDSGLDCCILEKPLDPSDLCAAVNRVADNPNR